jgi:hypothetical protein
MNCFYFGRFRILRTSQYFLQAFKVSFFLLQFTLKTNVSCLEENLVLKILAYSKLNSLVQPPWEILKHSPCSCLQSLAEIFRNFFLSWARISYHFYLLTLTMPSRVIWRKVNPPFLLSSPGYLQFHLDSLGRIFFPV